MPYDDEYGDDHRFRDARGHGGHGYRYARGRGAAGTGGGGVPDGLLVGALALLLGATVLTWTATGLAGLLSHGAWPEGVSFTNTPVAMRDLAADPRDLAGAWPHASPSQLSGYGLFWACSSGSCSS